MSNTRRPQNWSARENYEAVREYDLQPDEQAQGRYLRERGLYSVDVETWRKGMLEALSKKANRCDPKDRRIRELESELRRKEKALAETAALLTLKKTAQQIWGDDEDGR